MQRERNAFRLGVVLCAIIALFVGVVVYVPSGVLSGPLAELSVRFPHDYPLPLLEPGSPVLVGGQKVGAVRSVRVAELPVTPVRDAPPDAPTALYVVVQAELQASVRPRIDCAVVAEGPPLGGAGYLRVDIGREKAMLRPDTMVEGGFPTGFAAALDTVNRTLGAELDATRPGSLLGLIKGELDASRGPSLVGKLHRSMEDLNAVTASVRQQLDPQQRDALMTRLLAVMENVNQATALLRDQLDAQQPDVLMARLNAAVAALAAGLETTRAMLDENRGDVRDTIQHIAHTSHTLDTRIAEQVAAQTDASNAAGLTARLNEAAERLNVSLQNAAQISDVARGVAVLNRDNINETLRNLKQTSEHLKSAVKFVLRRPWLLFNAPPPGETREQDILDAARSFAEAAARLDDAASELKTLSEYNKGVIPADSPDLMRIRAALRDAFARFSDAEASLFDKLDVK